MCTFVVHLLMDDVFDLLGIAADHDVLRLPDPAGDRICRRGGPKESAIPEE